MRVELACPNDVQQIRAVILAIVNKGDSRRRAGYNNDDCLRSSQGEDQSWRGPADHMMNCKDK